MSGHDTVVLDEKAVVNDKLDSVLLGHKLRPKALAGPAFTDECVDFYSFQEEKKIKEHVVSIRGNAFPENTPSTGTSEEGRRNPVFFHFFAFCAVAVTILLRENPKGEKGEEEKRKKEEKPAFFVDSPRRPW
jgi:hypothetical protein